MFILIGSATGKAVAQWRANRFFKAKARTDSRGRRKEMADGKDPLPVTRRCELLDLPRSTFYHLPQPVCDVKLKLLMTIDRYHLELPLRGWIQYFRYSWCCIVLNGLNVAMAEFR